MKSAKASWAHGCFFIYNMISIQWLTFTCKSSFHTPCFSFYGHSFLFLYSELCWILIWQVLVLFNCLNMCNLVKPFHECSQFVASCLQVVFLIPRNTFHLRSSLVNGYHTAFQLLFAWKDLRHHLGI